MDDAVFWTDERVAAWERKVEAARAANVELYLSEPNEGSAEILTVFERVMASRRRMIERERAAEQRRIPEQAFADGEAPSDEGAE